MPSKAKELMDYLEDSTSLAVVCHDNPDPDCLASALGLREIAEEAGVSEVVIYYSGEVSHQENRAFVNLLDVELQRYSDDSFDGHDTVAFVDHSVAGVNNQVPAEVEVDVVVDHHESEDGVEADFVDLRQDYGATTTMLVEYFVELELEPEAKTATALMFGIRTETLAFLRDTSAREYEAAAYLQRHLDPDVLTEMTRPALSPQTLDTIGDAISEREVRASALVSCVGVTGERDALPQAADYLMQLEGIATVLVFGVVDDVIHLSARTEDSRVNVDAVMREAFDDVGSAGGHREMAGAQIPLGVFGELANDEKKLVNLMAQRVSKRFFDAMNLESDEDKVDD